MAMIHLIVIETRIYGKAAFAIENITLIICIDYVTRIYTSDGMYTEVAEPVEEIVKRINQIVYGTEK